jgi:hypothetical protein
MQRRLREGDHVFVGSQLEEGMILRDEEYGDLKVPVILLDDDQSILILDVDDCMLLDPTDDGSRVWA